MRCMRKDLHLEHQDRVNVSENPVCWCGGDCWPVYERAIRMDAVEGRDARITGMAESIYGSPSYESRALEAIHNQDTEYGTRFDRFTFPERDIDNRVEGYVGFYKITPSTTFA